MKGCTLVMNSLLIYTNDSKLEKQTKEIMRNHELNLSIEIFSLKDNMSFTTRPLEKSAIIMFDLDLIDESTRRKIALFVKEKGVNRAQLVMLESKPAIDEVRRFLKSGAFDFLPKPLTAESIYQLMQDISAGNRRRIQSNPPTYDKKMISYLKSSLAYDLVFGSVKNSKDIWDRCSVVGLSVVPNTAMVVHIDNFFKMVKNKSKQWEQLIRQEVKEAIRGYLQDAVQETLVIITDPNKIAVLLASKLKNSQLEYKITAKELAEEIKDYVLENTGYSITIGIGNYYEDARNLHISYIEAFHAQENNFFVGRNTVTHIGDVEPFENETKVILNYDILPLAKKVTIGDFIGVKDEIESLKKKLFSQKNINPKVFNLQITDILTSLARAAIHGGAEPKDIFYIHYQYGQELKNMESIVEVKQWFGEAIDNMLDQVLSNSNEQTLRSVQKAIKYIDQHFEKHISLEEISDYVSLSPNYFSNMFKKTTGQSFIEYVSVIRIEKSKEMLMNLNYTVHHIATAIGYTDARYFSRVFKSIVGKTPTQYRNSVIGTKFTKDND